MLNHNLVILDLDNVICDWCAAAYKVHNQPLVANTNWAFYKDWGLTTNQFWEPIEALGEKFYAELVQPTPLMEPLLRTVRYYQDEIIVATVPGRQKPAEYSGKRIWLDKYIPGAKLYVVPADSYSKNLLAREDRLLVDDCQAKVDEWKNYGGKGLVVPNAWNELRQLYSGEPEKLQAQIDYVTRGIHIFQGAKLDDPDFIRRY